MSNGTQIYVMGYDLTPPPKGILTSLPSLRSLLHEDSRPVASPQSAFHYSFNPRFATSVFRCSPKSVFLSS
jgi:hypothetical protein